MTTLQQILLSKLAADGTHQVHPGRPGRVHAPGRLTLCLSSPQDILETPKAVNAEAA